MPQYERRYGTPEGPPPHPGPLYEFYGGDARWEDRESFIEFCRAGCRDGRDDGTRTLRAMADRFIEARAGIVSRAHAAGRAELLAGEQRQFDCFDHEAQALERAIVDLTAQAASFRENQDPAVREAIEAIGAGSVRVGREASTYRPDVREHSFFRDAWAMRERLERNSREMADALRGRFPGQEFRDVGTSAFAGLVVPQYLVDLVAPIARAGSPLVNALVTKMPLPESGLTVNISRITTGTGVAAQATENAAVQETDADDTLLTVDVRTYAGMQDVSRQAIERGTSVDEVIYRDLVRAYFTTLDSAIINGAGSSGTHLGIRSTSSIISVAYTDASPTVPELYPKLADAIQQINATLFSPAQELASRYAPIVALKEQEGTCGETTVKGEPWHPTTVQI
ncbi:MAG: phage major capsid protein, partial [Gaiellaceae bacterium]